MSDIIATVPNTEDRTRTLLGDTSRLYHERIAEIRNVGNSQHVEAPELGFAAIALVAASFALEAGYSAEDIRAAARVLTAPRERKAEPVAPAL